MKLLFFLISTVVVFAEDSRLQLTPLKPKAVSGRPIGRVQGVLLNAADDKVIDTISADIGECGDCAGGVAVKGVLGFRFEGRSMDAVQVVKKSAAGVLYRECRQPELNRDFSCTFTFGRGTYTVKLEPISRRRSTRPRPAPAHPR